MPFELKRREKIDAGLKRIIDKEIDDAHGRLESGRGEFVETVHEVRKSIKKIRTGLRLLRGPISKSDYAFQNAYFRDIGHQLSEARDAQILIETLEKLSKPNPEIKRLLIAQRDGIDELL